MRNIIYIAIAGLFFTLSSMQSENNSDYDPIFLAAWHGDFETVKKAVDKGASADRIDEGNQGTSLLMAAASSNNTELVKYLISKGANVKRQDEAGETALHYAAWKGNLEVVKTLVEKGADVNAYYRANGGLTPLCCAAESGSFETVIYLVKNGADPHYEDKESGASPLRSAAYSNHFEIFKYFAEIKQADYSWQKVLYYGLIGGSLSTVKYTVEERKADVNKTAGYFREFPIEYAAKNRYRSFNDSSDFVGIIQYLISKGARLSDINGGKIFPWAMENSNELTIAYFLEQGVKVGEEANVYGWTPLASALDNDNFVLAKYLLKDKEAPEFKGIPLVVYFSDGMFNSRNIISFLIQNGVNKEYYSQAFIRCIQHNDTISAGLLLNAGADIQAKNEEGFNALSYIHSMDVGRFLIKKGIDLSNKQMFDCAWKNFALLNTLDEIHVDVNITQDQANEGLWTAAKIGDTQSVQYFLRKGADVNFRKEVSSGDSNEEDSLQTALIINAVQGYPWCSYDKDNLVSAEIAKLLIEAGADVHLKDNHGRTALHYASGNQACNVMIWPIPMGNRQDRLGGAHGDPAMPPQQRHDLIVEVLMMHRANLNAKDNEGKTPLSLAAEYKNKEILKLLKNTRKNP